MFNIQRKLIVMLAQPTNHQETAFVFQAYGKEELYKQVVLSILTLHYWLKGDFTNVRCVIYTDKPAAFSVLKNIPIFFELLTKESIIDYKGKYGFVHRLKICVLADAFKKYKCNIFYLDGDTYFVKSPKEILAGITRDGSVMHVEEYDMYNAGNYEDTSWLTIRKVLREHAFTIDGVTEKLPFSAIMWNAGVLGIAYDNAYLLDEVLDLSDQLYSKSQFFSAEQFSFSVILQKYTTVVPAENVIIHYWKNYGKVLFDYHLKSFIKINKGLNIDELADEAWKLVRNHHTLPMPKPRRLDLALKRLKLIIKVSLRGHV